MTEPKRDLSDVTSRPQDGQSACVSEAMWRYRFGPQRRAGLLSDGDMLLQDVLEPRTGHRLAAGVDKELDRLGVPAYALAVARVVGAGARR